MAGPFDDVLAIGRQARASAFDPAAMPTMADAAPPSEADQHGWFYNAARSGLNNLQANTDQAVAAGLKLAGADQQSRDWSKSAAEQSQEAQRFVMPELQASPGDPNFSWANLPKQIAYTVVQNVPNMVGAGLGAAAVGALAPEAFAGSAAAGLAGRALGTLGVEGGEVAGATALRNLTGATAASYPTAVGSMYGEAVERGNPTQADAAKAAIMGVPYAAGEGLELTLLGGLFKGAKAATPAGEGFMAAAKSVAYDAGKAMLNEGFTEGAQTIMEQSFRPDRSIGERTHDVVNAMFLGALGGLGMGGGASGAGHVLRAFNTVPAQEIAKNQGAMQDAVDAGLGLPPSNPPPNQSEQAPPESVAASAVNPPVEPGIEPTAAPTAEAAPISEAPVMPPAPPVAAPEFDPARPYSALPDNDLIQRLREAPKDSPVRAALNQEAAERVRRMEAEQRGETTETERLQAQQQFNMQLAKDAGVSKTGARTLQNMNVSDIASAYDTVEARMQDSFEKGKAPPQAVQKLNEYFGIFDKDGNKRDLKSELAVWQDAKESAPNAQTARKADEQIAQLNTLMDRQAQVSDRKAQLEADFKAREDERAAAAKAEQDLVKARELTSQPVQTLLNEQTASMKGPTKSAFLAGFRSGMEDGPMPVRGPIRNGWQLAKTYSEAQKLVEKDNASAAKKGSYEGAEPAQRLAQLVGENGRGNAAGAAVGPEGRVEGPALRQGEEGLPGGRVESLAAKGRKEESAAGVSEGPLTDFVARDKAPIRIGDAVRLTSRSGTETVLARVDKVIGSGDSARVLLVDERGGKRSMDRESFATSAALERSDSDVTLPALGPMQQQARDIYSQQLKEATKEYDQLENVNTDAMSDKEYDRHLNKLYALDDHIARLSDLIKGIDERGKQADRRDEFLRKLAPDETGFTRTLKKAKAQKVSTLRDELSQMNPKKLGPVRGFMRDQLMKLVGDTQVHVIEGGAFNDMHDYGSDSLYGLYTNLKGQGPRISVSSYLSGDRRDQTIIHEALHALAYRQLNHDTAFKVNVERIMAAFKQHLRDKHALNPYDRSDPRSKQFYYGFTNAHEFLSEAWGNAVFHDELSQAMLDDKLAEELGIKEWRGQSLWNALIEKLRVMLNRVGIPWGRDQVSALEAIVKITEGIAEVRNDEPVEVELPSRDAAPGSRPSAASRQAAATSDETAPRSASETVQAVSQRIANAVGEVAAATKSGKWLDQAVKTGRSWMLGWTTLHHLAEHYGKIMPQLKDLVNAQEVRRNVSNRWAAIALQATNMFEKLSPKVQETLSTLMADATELRLNPRAAWDSHKHLFKEYREGTLSKERLDELKAIHTKLNNQYYRDLPGSGADKVYDSLLDINVADRYAHHAVAMYRAMTLDEQLSPEMRQKLKAHGDPMARFLREANSNDAPKQLRKFWTKESDSVMALAKELVEQRKEALSQGKSNKSDTSLVKELYTQYTEEQGGMQQYPYFHLGRGGDFFVAFELATVDGKVQRDALVKLQDELDKILPKEQQVRISPHTVQSKVYIRVDNEQLMNTLETAVRKGALKNLVSQEKGVSAGDRTRLPGSAPSQKLLNQMLKEVDNSTAFDGDDESVQRAKQQMREFIKEFGRDIMPDISIDKSLAPRKNISGYNTNMIRSFAQRAQQGGLSLSRLSGSAQILDTLGSMQQTVKEANRVENPNRILLSQLYREAATREYQRVIEEHSTLIETLKALNHSYFLGFNPSHALLQQVSIPVLLLPELGKRSGVGFMKASKAIGAATNDAFKIMSALGLSAKDQGWKKAPSAVITPQVLEKALPGPENKAKRDFIMRVVNSGGIESGSESRELGRMAEGAGKGTIAHKFDLYTQYASMMGFYSETSTRLIAALSTYNVTQKADPEAQFHDALRTINETMFNFSNYNVARKMGRNGFLGPATPLVTAFMSYNTQLMEKLYRETHKALGGDAEARKFLLGHAAAVVAISGMMGLPFAGAFAAGFDKLKDWTDPEEGPHDLRASFRNHMDSIFGETMGDVLARGLPRLTGSDISERAGEGKLSPFDQFMSDRGSWKEKFEHLEARGFGSPASAVSNIMDGIDKLNSGDYRDGIRQFMPQGIKNMMDAYRMTDEGYVDAKGHKLPINADIEDQLRKFIGFKGDREADYGEVKQIDNRERTRLAQESGPIMRHLVDAISRGDQDAIDTYLEQAQEFDEQHPTNAILPKLQSKVNSSVTAQAIEEATGMPAGIKLENQHLMDNLQWYTRRAR